MSEAYRVKDGAFELDDQLVVDFEAYVFPAFQRVLGSMARPTHLWRKSNIDADILKSKSAFIGSQFLREFAIDHGWHAGMPLAGEGKANINAYPHLIKLLATLGKRDVDKLESYIAAFAVSQTDAPHERRSKRLIPSAVTEARRSFYQDHRQGYAMRIVDDLSEEKFKPGQMKNLFTDAGRTWKRLRELPGLTTRKAKEALKNATAFRQQTTANILTSRIERGRAVLDALRI